MNWNIQQLLTPEEIAFFSIVYQTVDPTNAGRVASKEAVNLLRKSSVPVSELKKIWQVAASASDGLDRSEFFIALKLISFVQNGIDVLEENVLGCLPSPLPQITGFDPPATYQQYGGQGQSSAPPLDPYEMSAKEYEKYANFFNTVDKVGRGFVTGQDGKQIFQKSQLPVSQLGDIWQLCDSNGKGYLFRDEFIVAIHIISLVKKNAPVPMVLPESLQKIIRDGYPSGAAQNAPSKHPPSQPATPQQSNQTSQIQFPQQYQQIQQNSMIIPQQQQIIQTQQLNSVGSDAQQQQMEANLLSQQVSEQQSKLQAQLQSNSSFQKQRDYLAQLIEDKRRDLQFLDDTLANYQQLWNEEQLQTQQLKEILNELAKQHEQKVGLVMQMQAQVQQQQAINSGLRQQVQSTLSEMSNVNFQQANQLQSQSGNFSSGKIAGHPPSLLIGQIPGQIPVQGVQMVNQGPTTQGVQMVNQGGMNHQLSSGQNYQQNEEDDYASYRAKKQTVQSGKSNYDQPPKQQEEEQFPW